MSKGFFICLDIDNEKEILVVDAFIEKVDLDYKGKQSNGKQISLGEVKKPISGNFTGFMTVVGLISALILLVLLYDNANSFLAIFSLLTLVGYGYTFMQLKRAEDFVESVKTIQKKVHDHRQNEERIEAFVNSIKKNKEND
ncbi:MAG: hypothetical protein K0R34_1371 [Herbinix sp.]|jgi:hypothetical protein|nr:hypothetical protein [Herbinix sp.]